MKRSRLTHTLALAVAGAFLAFAAHAAELPKSDSAPDHEWSDDAPPMPPMDGDLEFSDEDDLMAMDMGRGDHRAPHAPGRGRNAAEREKLHEALKLTDTQREKLEDIHERAARQRIQLRAQIETARLDLHKLMREDNPNLSEINSAIDRLSKVEADAHKARVATLLEARTVFTPEQRKLLRQHRGHGMMGMGMERGGRKGPRGPMGHGGPGSHGDPH